MCWEVLERVDVVAKTLHLKSALFCLVVAILLSLRRTLVHLNKIEVSLRPYLKGTSYRAHMKLFT